VPTAASEAPESSMAYRSRASELIAKLGTIEQSGLSEEEVRTTDPRYRRAFASPGLDVFVCPSLAS
jgi:hypothetical protein